MTDEKQMDLVQTDVLEMEQEVERDSIAPVPVNTYLENPVQFEHLQRIAKLYSTSKQMVPEQYRNSFADCFLAIQLSKECGINPVVFMQNSYPVKGRIGIEGKLAIAMVNRAGIYEDRMKFRFEGQGDARKCTAWGKLKTSGDIEEMTVSIEMAKKAGWWGKSGSFWPTLTDQMLIYRSGAYLVRAYHPEILLGLDLKDELPDMEKRQSQGAADLTNKLSQKKH